MCSQAQKSEPCGCLLQGARSIPSSIYHSVEEMAVSAGQTVEEYIEAAKRSAASAGQTLDDYLEAVKRRAAAAYEGAKETLHMGADTAQEVRAT